MKTYESYADCIEQVEDPLDFTNRANGHISTQQFYDFALHLRTQANYVQVSEWIKFFEREYGCAGICKPRLFSWSHGVSSGRVT